MPCRINVFSGRKRERSPRENPPNGDFGGFSHGDLSPRQAKIRQTVAENATHGMSRTFVWRGERSPREYPKKSTFGEFSRGELHPAMQRYDKQGQKRERSPRENPPNGDFGGFSHGDPSPRQTKIRQTVGI